MFIVEARKSETSQLFSKVTSTRPVRISRNTIGYEVLYHFLVWRGVEEIKLSECLID